MVGVESASCVALALRSIVLVFLSWMVGLGLLFTTSVVVLAAAMAARTERRKKLAFIFVVLFLVVLMSGQVADTIMICECAKTQPIIVAVMIYQLTDLELIPRPWSLFILLRVRSTS